MNTLKNFLKPLPKTLIYILLGLLWIFITDHIFFYISHNLNTLKNVQLIKGIIFVLLSGVGLYIIIYFYNRNLIKLNKLYEKKVRIFNMLSQCNQILVRNTDENKFLYEICKLIVKIGGYRMAWIGFKQDDEQKTVKPLAYFGFEEGYLGKIKISWEENEYGKGPTGTAIRTGKSIIFSNLEKSINYKMWLNAAVKRGYKSSCAIPIIVNNEILGALNIYSSEIDSFNKEEIIILEEMAKDIGYGIKERRNYKENLELLKKIEDDNIRLKEIDKLKTNFLSIISHELRTPITPIKGFINILLNSPNNLTEKQKEYLNIIKNNTIRLQKLIEDLIDLSKIEKGIITIKKENTNIGEVIEQIINDMKYIIEQKQIKIEYNKKEIQIMIDKYRISQVLINLLNNAIKFSNINGKIYIDCNIKLGKEIKLPEYIKFNIDYEKKYIWIYIRDFGQGIKKDDLLKIFDNFYQIADPLTREFGGLGLGLSISKKIIELHNGVIWAESEGEGKGTILNFILPL